MHYFAAQGSSIGQAQQQAIAWIGQQVQAQASLLAYMDVFWTLMPVSAAAVPLALLLRKVKLGGEVHLGHSHLELPVGTRSQVPSRGRVLRAKKIIGSNLIDG